MQRFFAGLLYVLLMGIFPFSVTAQVSWVSKFDEALKQAQTQNKFIVVDLFASWCPPCQKMAREVYPDPEFIEFSRSQVYMLLDAELDGEGLRLARKFEVHSYPTILVLDSKGQEIDRLTGQRDAKLFMRDLQQIFVNPEPYVELIKKAKENTNDPNLQFRAGNRAFDRDDYALARQFFGRAASAAQGNPDLQSSAFLLLSSACYKDGKHPEALKAMDEFERIAPQLAQKDENIRMLRGRILVACKRYEEGYKVLSELLRSSRSKKEIETARSALAQLPGKYRKGDKAFGNLLEKAKAELQKEKLDSALSLATQAADLAPQSAEVHMLLAAIHIRIGNTKVEPTDKSQHMSACLNEIRLARRLDPEDMNGYLAAKSALAFQIMPQVPASSEGRKSYALAETRFAEGRYEEAVKAYMKTIELEPSFGKAFLHLGDCFFASGRIEEALTFYKQAIDRTSLDASAHRFAAHALQKLGRLGESRDYIISSLLADPEYPMIWRDLEQLAKPEGRQVQRHVDIVPIQFLLLSMDAGSYDESMYDGLPPQTVPAWREYVRNKLLWQQEKFHKIFPQAPFYSTTFEEEQECLQAAIQKWDSMKTQDPSLRDDNLDFLRQISVDGQIAAFIFIELFTEQYRSAYERWKQENRDAAIKYVREYLVGAVGVQSKGEYNSSAIEAYNNALLSYKVGDKNKAIDLYRRALAQEPQMAPALRNISILYLEINDFENARPALQKWAEAEPMTADPHIMLAQIQYRAGDLQGAARSAEKAISLEKDSTKKSQYQQILDAVRPRDGVGTDASRAPRSRVSDPDDESEGRIAGLEKQIASLKDGEEKDSLLLVLAVAHYNLGNWAQARRYANMVLARDPAQVTAKAIIENLQDK